MIKKESSRWVVFLLFFVVWFAACAQAAPEGTPAVAPIPSAPPIPATFTPVPAGGLVNPSIPVVTVTQAPLPATSTPIPFGANVVEIRLSIPSIQFDRRLQGSVNSKIILVDESNGFSVQRDNQASVLLDLQQVLQELVLNPVPEGCDRCVSLTYSLPFSGVEGSGWLRDPVLLASLENYFTTTLGPHFPPEAVIGLRRSASPYAPAHTLSVLPDGRMYRWLVSEGEAAPEGTAPPEMLAALEALEPDSLAQQYTAPCPGTPLESLYLAGRENERLIALVCPEFALSDELQPLYVTLDAALQEMLEASNTTLTRPPAAFPLTAVLDYQRIDNVHLTIFMDGTAVALNNNSQTITATLSSTQVVSLTTNLLASGALRTGLTSFLAVDQSSGATATPNSPRSLLLVRGPAGVYDGQWFNVTEISVLAELNELLNVILSGESNDLQPTGEATIVDSADEQDEATPIPIPTATPPR